MTAPSATEALREPAGDGVLTESAVGSALGAPAASGAAPWWPLFAFWPLTALILWLDSTHALSATGADLQLAANVGAPLYLAALMVQLSPQRRLLAVLFVPLTALGEALFSLVFGLYTYRHGGVPLYVPFGHAVLLTTGLYIVDLPPVQRNAERLRRALNGLLAVAFAGVVVLLGDWLSAAFGVLYVLVLLRRRRQLFHPVMALLVVFVELTGTAFGCWRWEPLAFGVLPTVNPPLGAFACYLVADMLGMKAARGIERLRAARARSARPVPPRGWAGG